MEKIREIRKPELKNMEVDILHLINKISKHENREMGVIDSLYH